MGWEEKEAILEARGSDSGMSNAICLEACVWARKFESTGALLDQASGLALAASETAREPEV